MAVPVELKSAEYTILASPSAMDTSLLRPPSTTIGFTFGAVSSVGKVRTKNEDHFLISQFSRKQTILATNVGAEHIPEHVGDDAYSMIVADGMGGMAAGEVASRMAITIGIQLFAKSPKWGFKVNKKEARELLDRVNAYLREIDLALTEHSESDHRLFGMGTTLTAAYSIGVDLFIIHIGDSRAYLDAQGPDQTVDQGPHGRSGHGRRRLHRSRGSAPPYQAQRARPTFSAAIAARSRPTSAGCGSPTATGSSCAATA